MKTGGNGFTVTVRLTPRSGRNAITGTACDEAGNPHLLARVSAAPVDDAANRALIALLAKWLDVPKRTLSIVRGAKSRLKTIGIDGDPVALRSRLQERIAMLEDENRKDPAVDK